jgi:hypothetical protein
VHPHGIAAGSIPNTIFYLQVVTAQSIMSYEMSPMQHVGATGKQSAIGNRAARASIALKLTDSRSLQSQSIAGSRARVRSPARSSATRSCKAFLMFRPSMQAISQFLLCALGKRSALRTMSLTKSPCLVQASLRSRRRCSRPPAFRRRQSTWRCHGQIQQTSLRVHLSREQC